MNSNDKNSPLNTKATRTAVMRFFSTVADAIQSRTKAKETPRRPCLETAYMRDDFSIELTVAPLEESSPESVAAMTTMEFLVMPHSSAYVAVLKNHPVLRPGVMHSIQREM